MRLWEVLWTDLPCPNFHILLCVAILDTQKHDLMENNYGFNEILKVIAHVPYVTSNYTSLLPCGVADFMSAVQMPPEKAI
jgi:hypothetical protein